MSAGSDAQASQAAPGAGSGGGGDSVDGYFELIVGSLVVDNHLGRDCQLSRLWNSAKSRLAFSIISLVSLNSFQVASAAS